jgi:hypothetical protein
MIINKEEKKSRKKKKDLKEKQTDEESQRKFVRIMKREKMVSGMMMNMFKHLDYS